MSGESSFPKRKSHHHSPPCSAACAWRPSSSAGGFSGRDSCLEGWLGAKVVQKPPPPAPLYSFLARTSSIAPRLLRLLARHEWEFWLFGHVSGRSSGSVASQKIEWHGRRRALFAGKMDLWAMDGALLVLVVLARCGRSHVSRNERSVVPSKQSNFARGRRCSRC